MRERPRKHVRQSHPDSEKVSEILVTCPILCNATRFYQLNFQTRNFSTFKLRLNHEKYKNVPILILTALKTSLLHRNAKSSEGQPKIYENLNF